MRRMAIFSGLLALTFAMPAMAQTPSAHEIAYGSDRLQKFDFYAAKDASRPAPLVVFVHGGGWMRGDKGNGTDAAKVAHFAARGFAFASVNYRLVPAARVEDQAQDVADALGYLVRHVADLGVDASRIVLIGHSAGAHLAALVGTDPQYLRRAGLGMNQIDGVVLLDGAAYDVPVQMKEGAPMMRGTYQQAFGSDPARQRALSPTLQAAVPNAPAFLILHVDRADGREQSEALAAALRAAGTSVSVQGLEGRGLAGHAQINRELGEAAYPGTGIVDAWMDGIFGNTRR